MYRIGIPNESSSRYIDRGYDSMVFHDHQDPGRVLKYYNYSDSFGNKHLSLEDIHEYHRVHGRYANIGPIQGIASYMGKVRAFSVAILDLGDDISQIEGSKVIVTRVPKVQGYHCIIEDILQAAGDALRNAGIPIETSILREDGHHLSPRNVHCIEKEDGKLDIVITDLGSSIKRSLEIERLLQKQN